MDARAQTQNAVGPSQCSDRTLSQQVVRLAELLELRGDRNHRVLRVAATELEREEHARRRLLEVKEHVGELDALLSRADVVDGEHVCLPLAALIESLRRVRKSVGFDV